MDISSATSVMGAGIDDGGRGLPGRAMTQLRRPGRHYPRGKLWLKRLRVADELQSVIQVLRGNMQVVRGSSLNQGAP